MVELCSAAMLFNVWRYRSWKENTVAGFYLFHQARYQLYCDVVSCNVQWGCPEMTSSFGDRAGEGCAINQNDNDDQRHLSGVSAKIDDQGMGVGFRRV